MAYPLSKRSKTQQYDLDKGKNLKKLLHISKDSIQNYSEFNNSLIIRTLLLSKLEKETHHEINGSIKTM